MQNTLKYNTYNVHNGSHYKLEYKKTSAKLLLNRNMRHISYNDFLATMDDGN